jgi:formylmethanofuran--tetrahydromethanopterin N-formyltransferase
MQLGKTLIDDTFAEAFRIRYARLIVTAHDDYWLNAATQAFCGYATSIIACDAEAGVERLLTPDETPDGRPGAAIMVVGFAPDSLGKAINNRTGQCLMTCPSTAVYDGLPGATDRIPLGKHLRFFGDGYQKSKVIDGHRYWRIPVMDGEFLVEDVLGVEKGVGGGNIIVQASKMDAALSAVRRAIEQVAALPGVITRVESRLHPETNCALEIVIDGVDETAVGQAMAAAMRAAAGDDVVAITAGNYGGKLGKFHFHLRELLGGKRELAAV